MLMPHTDLLFCIRQHLHLKENYRVQSIYASKLGLKQRLYLVSLLLGLGCLFLLFISFIISLALVLFTIFVIVAIPLLLFRLFLRVINRNHPQGQNYTLKENLSLFIQEIQIKLHRMTRWFSQKIKSKYTSFKEKTPIKTEIQTCHPSQKSEIKKQKKNFDR